MLDIRFIRQNTEEVRKNWQKRNQPELLIKLDRILELDRLLRELQQEGDELRKERNTASQNVNKAKKEGKDIVELLKKIKEIPVKVKECEDQASKYTSELRALLLETPNIMHESVPVGKDDTENVTIGFVGKKPEDTFTKISHVDLIKDLDLVDLERAAKITGARWYFIKEKLALLDMALVRYGIDFMRKRGFEFIVPPHMMRREAYEGVTSLADFEEVLYKIEGEDLHMIATSEHPLTAMHMDETLEEEELPKKYAGYSVNFRKEAGSHGKDTKGIFRVHQFNKVEQVIICKPEDSWKIHEELRKNGEEFFASLGLHCRTVNVCTGDLGIVAAKKYDLECWMPVQQTYREVQSCSNCTAYQATRLNIKMRTKDGNKVHVHTLNNTLVATARALVAIIENFQNQDGSITIPEVLRPYTGFDKIENKKQA